MTSFVFIVVERGTALDAHWIIVASVFPRQVEVGHPYKSSFEEHLFLESTYLRNICVLRIVLLINTSPILPSEVLFPSDNFQG